MPRERRGHDDGCDSSVVTLCNLYGPRRRNDRGIVPPRGSSQLAQLVSVPIGRPIDDCEVLLVDPQSKRSFQPVKPGEGEICFDLGRHRHATFPGLPELTSKVVLAGRPSGGASFERAISANGRPAIPTPPPEFSGATARSNYAAFGSHGHTVSVCDSNAMITLERSRGAVLSSCRALPLARARYCERALLLGEATGKGGVGG